MNELIRIDRRMAFSITELLKNIPEEDKMLCKNLLIYIAYKYRNSLFSDGIIDINEFAEEFGYNPKYLITQHPDPQILKEPVINYPEKARYFTTYIGNALYCLKRFDVNVLKYEQGGKVEIVNFKLINSLSEKTIGNVNDKRSRTYQYSYVADGLFLDNLTNFFVLTQKKAFLQLKNTYSVDLYLFLKNSKEALKHSLNNYPDSKELECWDISFETLCTIAHVSDYKKEVNGQTIYENKYRKRDLIKHLDNIIKAEPFFSYEFYRDKVSKWSYNLKFNFRLDSNDEHFLYNKFKNLQNGRFVEERIVSSERFRIFVETYYKTMLKYLKDNNKSNQEISEEDFYKWLGSDQDVFEKENFFVHSYIIVFTKGAEEFAKKRYGPYAQKLRSTKITCFEDFFNVFMM